MCRMAEKAQQPDDGDESQRLNRTPIAEGLSAPKSEIAKNAAPIKAAGIAMD